MTELPPSPAPAPEPAPEPLQDPAASPAPSSPPDPTPAPAPVAAPASSGLTRGLFVLAAVAVLIFFLQSAQAVMVPFLLSLFVAVIAEVPVSFLRRWLPAWLAVTVVALALVCLVTLAVLLIGTAAAEFTSRIPVYSERINEELSGYVHRLPMAQDQSVGDLIREAGVSRMTLNLVSGLLVGLRAALGNTLLIFFTVVFLLLESSAFPAKLKTALGQARSQVPILYFRRVIEKLKHYLSIKTVISLVTGILVTLLTTLVGLDSPVLWGLLAFLLNYIPNIGSILAAVPAVLLALVQSGAGAAIATAVGFLVINITFGSIVEPRVMGQGLGLSTLVVFLSLIFWGWVLGPVGILLSAPLTMTLKLGLEDHRETRWIAVLLGPGEPKPVRPVTD